MRFGAARSFLDFVNAKNSPGFYRLNKPHSILGESHQSMPRTKTRRRYAWLARSVMNRGSIRGSHAR